MAEVSFPSATARQMSGTDPKGRNILAVLVKVTYTFTPDGRVAIAPEQIPLNLDMIPNPDEPRMLDADTDVYPHKLATDVVLAGHAYAYEPRPTFAVSLRVGSTRKSIQVFGDRHCRTSTTGRIVFSSPEPVDRVPLGYERAYGGEDQSATAKYGNPFAELAKYLAPSLADARPSFYSYPRNPVGRGYLVEDTADAIARVQLPNLEDPLDLLTPERLTVGHVNHWPDMPLPQSMGWVSAGWFPRLAYFGFVPEFRLPVRPLAEIVRGHAPDDILVNKPITEKFDYRCANGASLGLQVPYLGGGEQIELSHLHPKAARVSFRLPEQRPVLWTDGRGGKLNETKAVIHTVILEPDAGRFSIVWRGSAPALRPYTPDELERMPFRVEWS